MSALLELEGVTRRFGGLNAVEGVSFSVAQGEIVGLIGPNGAGRTTLINVITGVHPASSGRVRFDGQDITHRRPHQIARGRRPCGRRHAVRQPLRSRCGRWRR